MRYMKLVVAALAAIILQGCVTYQPAISDVSDSAVKVQIQANPFVKLDGAAVNAEAKRGCGLYDKHATPLSSRCIAFDGSYCRIKEFLFSCN